MGDIEREAVAEPTTDEDESVEAEGRFMRREWLSIAFFSIAMTLFLAVALLALSGLIDLPADWLLLVVLALGLLVLFGWIRYRQATGA